MPGVEGRITYPTQLRRQQIAAIGKRFKPEQMVNLLREIEVMMANGKTLLEACKQVGISDKSYYRWRKIYGGPRDLKQSKQRIPG